MVRMILNNEVAGGGYGAMGEFHDLFMGDAWARLAPYVQVEFGALDPTAVVLDLGAGSGLGTRELGSATRAEIVALEPDLVMRSTLLSRVADDPRLATRTTVVAGRAPDDLELLPTPVDGFVCTHMLGHLRPGDRRTLFAWLDRHLRLGGSGVVTLSVGRSDGQEYAAARRVGRYDYREIGVPCPDGYATRYEVWCCDRLLRSETFAGTWAAVTAEDLAREVDGLRLAVEPLAAGIARIVRTRG